jgi:hypothetical protein
LIKKLVPYISQLEHWRQHGRVDGLPRVANDSGEER